MSTKCGLCQVADDVPQRLPRPPNYWRKVLVCPVIFSEKRDGLGIMGISRPEISVLLSYLVDSKVAPDLGQDTCGRDNRIGVVRVVLRDHSRPIVEFVKNIVSEPPGISGCA